MHLPHNVIDADPFLTSAVEAAHKVGLEVLASIASVPPGSGLFALGNLADHHLLPACKRRLHSIRDLTTHASMGRQAPPTTVERFRQATLMAAVEIAMARALSPKVRQAREQLQEALEHAAKTEHRLTYLRAANFIIAVNQLQDMRRLEVLLERALEQLPRWVPDIDAVNSAMHSHVSDLLKEHFPDGKFALDGPLKEQS